MICKNCHTDKFVVASAHCQVCHNRWFFDATQDTRIAGLEAELASLRAAAAWNPASEPPETENDWSRFVLVAFKVDCEGSKHHKGMQAVSRYFRHHKTGAMEWEYSDKTLSEYGYEPIAWRDLPEFAEAV